MTSGYLIMKVAHSFFTSSSAYNQSWLRFEQMVCLFTHSKKLLGVNLHVKSLSTFLSLTLQKLLQVALYRPGCIIPGFHSEVSTLSRVA